MSETKSIVLIVLSYAAELVVFGGTITGLMCVLNEAL